MSFLQRDFLESIAVTLASSLQEAGIELTIGHDFNQYKEMVEASRTGHKIGRPFDPQRHTLDKTSAFWIIGKNEGGAVVHSQAARLLDIRQESVAEYLERRYMDFPPPLPDLDYSRSRYRKGPSAKYMSGIVSYHGEFWVDHEAGNYRGNGLVSDLCRFGYEQAKHFWDPDHFFAFMLEPVGAKGLGARAGWMHMQPRALSWALRGQESLIETFMCHISRADLEYLQELAAEEYGLIAA